LAASRSKWRGKLLSYLIWEAQRPRPLQREWRAEWGKVLEKLFLLLLLLA
jgi:hypothetical protein